MCSLTSVLHFLSCLSGVPTGCAQESSSLLHVSDTSALLRLLVSVPGASFSPAFGLVKLLSLTNLLLSTEGCFSSPPQQFHFSLLKDLSGFLESCLVFDRLLSLIFVTLFIVSADLHVWRISGSKSVTCCFCQLSFMTDYFPVCWVIGWPVTCSKLVEDLSAFIENDLQYWTLLNSDSGDKEGKLF